MKKLVSFLAIVLLTITPVVALGQSYISLGMSSLLVLPSVHAEERISLPQWIKNTAQWWSEGKTTDKKFSIALSWIIQTKNIAVHPELYDDIPSWAKNLASFWSDNMISDNEFFNAIKFLVEHNIVKLKPETLRIIEAKGLTEVPYSGESPLFKSFAYAKDIVRVNGNPIALEVQFALKPELNETYKEIAVWYKPHSAAVIVPLFTTTAYWEPGFYTYYRGDCGPICLTKKIEFDQPLRFSASANGVAVLKLLGYDTITDLDVNENPQILQQYDKVIMLHSEYVTKNEFDAIISHPKVIYLYANPLYAEVTVNYQNDTITLVKGHGYPIKDIGNAFGWKFDNSKYEYDTNCSDNKFYKVDNGIMWDCYPENTIFTNMTLLKIIKDY